jgi:hypothetical protein
VTLFASWRPREYDGQVVTRQGDQVTLLLSTGHVISGELVELHEASCIVGAASVNLAHVVSVADLIEGLDRRRKVW